MAVTFMLSTLLGAFILFGIPLLATYLIWRFVEANEAWREAERRWGK